MKKTIFSGMRPTGKLHLGHLVGAITNWVKLQDNYSCVFGIVDWHALMSEYEQGEHISRNIVEMAIDWVACGLDPERSIICVQSHIPEHLELAMFFGCLTPLGWLERNPTYKEQLRELTARDIHTYGFLGYPVLQAADILLYKAAAVPVGEDQLPHIELTREIGRRFNHLYKAGLFPDCEALLTTTPRLMGIDNRKMSKSYDNAINLSDSPDEVRRKVQSMVTDPKRIRLSDPGHPDVCTVYDYYSVFAPDKKDDVHHWCVNAQKGCTECKRILADTILEKIAPIQEKRRSLEKNPQRIIDILHDGDVRARAIAQQTMAEVREAVFKKDIRPAVTRPTK